MPRHRDIPPDRGLVRRGARHVRTGIAIVAAAVAGIVALVLMEPFRPRGIAAVAGVVLPAVLYVAALYHGSRIAGFVATGMAMVLGGIGVLAVLAGTMLLALRVAHAGDFQATTLLAGVAVLVVAAGFALTWMTAPAAAWHEARRQARRRESLSLDEWRRAGEGTP